jgi:hypothetical protein
MQPPIQTKTLSSFELNLLQSEMEKMKIVYDYGLIAFPIVLAIAIASWNKTKSPWNLKQRTSEEENDIQ